MGKHTCDVDREIYELLMAIRNSDIYALTRIMKQHGYTDLHLAVMECKVGRIRRLLERGADPNAKNEMEMTPLHEAAKSCPEAIPLLIKHGADPHAREEGGLTPLHIAALEGSAEATKALIPHSDINARDTKGRSPLHLALEYGNCNVAALLLGAGADPNVADGGGRTPLHLAAQAGCAEVVKALLERGADPGARDRDSRTVLHYAVKSLNKDVVALVIRRSNVNARDVRGETPLRYLIRECARWESGQCREIARLLLEHGADPAIPDTKGITPLDSARRGCPELAELFKK